ncbi:MAG: type II and III secretion system protein [Bacteroidales bacterium]|nr:type II and III secretion system protein [Bacteroidales bacterium]
MKKLSIIIFFITIISVQARSNNDYENTEKNLRALSDSIPALMQEVDITVTGISIPEFLRGVAHNTGLNLNVDNSVTGDIVNNFRGVKTVDVLLFLCKEYGFSIRSIGNILTIYKPYIAPTEVDKVIWNDSTKTVSLDFRQEKLADVIRLITTETGQNIAVESDVESKTINFFVRNAPLGNAIDKMAYSNGLQYKQDEDGFAILNKQEVQPRSSRSVSRDEYQPHETYKPRGTLIISDKKHIELSLVDEPFMPFVRELCDKLGISYVFLEPIERKVNFFGKDVSFNDLLVSITEGTPYTFLNSDGVMLFGQRVKSELFKNRIIKMVNRSVDSLSMSIPKSLKQGCEIKELLEYNSLLVSGPEPSVNKVEDFVKQLDTSIPVVLIEVMIVDVKKNYSIETGIRAGVGTNPTPTKQSILPGVDYTLSTKSLNNLVSGFNGMFSTSIGKVSSNFYLSLKAMEDNGILKIRSTPKLSTLNGRKATLTSGEKKYYKEERSQYYGTQNPQMSNSYEWKPLEAQLKLTIVPIVSAGEEITLSIEVEQSEFTAREFDGAAPPGSITRKFVSSIRVKNEEMVLLGGLEKITNVDTSTGVPLLARIPVIKWLFSSRTKQKNNDKLNIFIKPVILN